LDDVRLLLWDHRRVNLVAHHRLPFRRWLSLPVGYYGVIGIHHFGGLGELLRDHEDVVASALQPLFAPPLLAGDARGVRRRGRLLRRLRRRVASPTNGTASLRRGRPTVFRLLGAPRNYGAKAALLAQLLVADRAMRALYLASRRDAQLRLSLSSAEVLEDILKLHVLRQASRGCVADVAHVDVLESDGELTFVTRDQTPERRSSWPNFDRTSPLRRIAWDNREVGSSLGYPTALNRTLEVAAGVDGVHYFTALERLAEHHADAVWDALPSSREAS
jgi:hypothetical protein